VSHDAEWWEAMLPKVKVTASWVALGIGGGNRGTLLILSREVDSRRHKKKRFCLEDFYAFYL